MSRRVLFIWFPHLAAERRLRRESWLDPSRPFATLKKQAGAWRLSSVTPAAARIGLAPGASLADAKAVAPRLATAPEEPERVQAFLSALGRWCWRYTPWIALEPPDGLALDIAGCAHLHGGEAPLMADAAARLRAMGLTVRLGLADAKGAAWAFARYGAGAESAPAGADRAALLERLGDLPVAALRIEAKCAAALARVGLRRIADLAAPPRAALSRRFGPEPGRRLDEAFGDAPEPLTPVPFQRPYAVRLHLPEPIGATADVRAGLERLLARLCARLEQERRGARRLRLSIQRCDQTDAAEGAAATIGLARPCADPRRIAPLFERAIDALDAGFGIDALRLEALSVEPIAPEQTDAWRRGAASDALCDLVARIGNRFSFEHAIRFAPAQSHLPERAFIRALAAETDPTPFAEGGSPRPLALFEPEAIKAESGGAPPARFAWRGALYAVQTAIGPERIAPEWWRDDPAWRSGPRDYWRVQTEAGARLWMFRLPEKAPDAPTDGARWFAHGMFP